MTAKMADYFSGKMALMRVSTAGALMAVMGALLRVSLMAVYRLHGMVT